MSEHGDSTDPTGALKEDYDPIRAEIIRRRLYSITQEMGTVMIRTSGDPVISEAKDFATFVTDADGNITSLSGYILFHSGPVRSAIQHVIENYSADEINPGDQFITNDPHTTGILHPPDVAIIKPIFRDGELISWCLSVAHLIDVGGIQPGGFAPQAQEAYAEALRWPGIKIVEEGKINEDIKRLHDTNVRIPSRVFNDIRALIAANNRCEERILDTVEEFGLDEYERYVGVNRELTTGALRERLHELPDGTWEITEHVEHDGHENRLYELPIEMTIDGGSLSVDLSGAAEQAQGFINLSSAGATGAVPSTLALLLAPDVPFNAGFFDPVEVVTPPGTIVNPELPAATSAAHMETGFKIFRGLVILLGRAMAQSENEFVREHIMAPYHEAWAVAQFYGLNQYGEPDVFLDMTGGGAGGGAQSIFDGMDVGGTYAQLSNSVPDIEINEDEHPILYLWRKIRTDSAGPGEYRGGQGVEYAWALNDVEGGQETVSSQVTQRPTGAVQGGYPGSTTVFEILRDTDIREQIGADRLPNDLDEVKGQYEQLPAKASNVPLDPDVVFSNREGAGSGLGDPLERDPDLAARDVADGYLSESVVADVYGVVLEDGEVDEAATERRRADIRSRRTEWDVEAELETSVEVAGIVGPFHRYVNVVEASDGQYLACDNCDSVLAPFAGADDEGWLTYLASNRSPVEERFDDLHLFVQERDAEPDVILTEHACPDCGILLRTDVVTA